MYTSSNLIILHVLFMAILNNKPSSISHQSTSVWLRKGDHIRHTYLIMEWYGVGALLWLGIVCWWDEFKWLESKFVQISSLEDAYLFSTITTWEHGVLYISYFHWIILESKLLAGGKEGYVKRVGCFYHYGIVKILV